MNTAFKKILSIIITGAMVFAMMPAASASGGSHVTISVSPQELTQAGNVTVTITLKNTNSGVAPVTPAPTFVPTPIPTETPAAPTGTPEATPTPTDTPAPTEALTLAPTEGPAATREPTPQPTESSTPIETMAPTDGPVEGSILNFFTSVASFFTGSLVNMTSSVSYGSYTDIKISNSYGVAFSTSGVTVAPGSSKSFTATMKVTNGMIGVNLPFTVSWNDNGVARFETVSCKIARKNAAPYLEVTRTADPANASEGTEVTFNYTFTNTGSVTLVNIVLVDRYVYGSSSAMTTIASLEPGASRDFEFIMTMGESTVVSSPVVTFYAQGGSTKLTNNVSPITIGLIQSQLTKEIIQSNPTPEGVQFTIYLTNNGNQKLSSLKVTDEKGDPVSDKEFSLAVGEQKVLEYFVKNPKSVRYVVFNIEGTDYNGTEFKDNTASYPVRPYIDPSLLSLSFNAGTLTSINEDNTVRVEFEVENTGSLAFSNLSVTEQSLGYDIYSWSKLDVGEFEKVEVDINIGSETDLVFILTAEDPSGNIHKHEAYLTAEHINVDDLIPTDDPSKDEPIDVVDDDPEIGRKLDGLITSTGEKLQTWFRILGIIAGAAAVTMLILGITEIVIRRNKRSNNGNK